jgi:hypothetical protein
MIEMRRMIGYQGAIEERRRSPYMQFPSHVHLETYALCNAGCGFCPYESLERKGVRMSDALIEKIIAGLQAIPKTLPFCLSPFKVNEPFLDTRLFDVLKLANDRLPNALITLTTNASPLTERHISRLGSVRNLKYLWISLNECDPARYEAAMKLPWERTQQRLAALHESRQSGALATKIILSRVSGEPEADREFARWVATTYPAFDSYIFERGDWLGQAGTATGDVPPVGCQRWFELSISATGVVAHCCMDGQAAYPIGDARSENVLDIYNSRAYRRLRESCEHRTAFEPCRTCTFL